MTRIVLIRRDDLSLENRNVAKRKVVQYTRIVSELVRMERVVATKILQGIEVVNRPRLESNV